MTTLQTRLETHDLVAQEGPKALGAFYTDDQIAQFLVWWAIRSGQDTVMDPSFGGGVFLRAACERLTELGGQPACQVFGVEVDAMAHRRAVEDLCSDFGVRTQNLPLSDFFALDSTVMQPVDVVVGNPPFIRYQRFCGDARRTALRRVAAEGVQLSELSSSWAPFLVHSIAMLKTGGRLAMVVPMEMCHAAYALPVLDHLAKSFAKVTFLTFRDKLFPDLSENTFLLLAEGKGAHSTAFLWRDLTNADRLPEMQQRGHWRVPGTHRIDAQTLSRGHERLVEHFLPRKTRDLYRELRKLAQVRRLGDVADVGIGYVTGANDFFHLHPDEARMWGIPESFLKPAVRRGRALLGLRFTRDDWRQALETGEAGYLLLIEPESPLPASLRRYLQNGESQGVSKTFKCRMRSPWFCVPHVHQSDAFLSYMSGAVPRLVANHADAVATNSLHVLRLHAHTRLTRDALAALWQTFLTRLSVEVEGHPLGGGMLKLEPTEAENVILSLPPVTNGELARLAEELDGLVRAGNDRAAQEQADAEILQKGIGLTQADCRLLHEGAATLRERRYSRIPRA
ncbi:MAG: SAM-dependent DNA methyltransferase [Planctomycetes bacterium]|nr:SAM-dependent DNA methyltransferase [Planctomycetota bacterium]